MRARVQKLDQPPSGVTLEGGGSVVEVEELLLLCFFTSPLNQKLSEELHTDTNFLKIRNIYSGNLMKQC